MQVGPTIFFHAGRLAFLSAAWGSCDIFVSLLCISSLVGVTLRPRRDDTVAPGMAILAKKRTKTDGQSDRHSEIPFTKTN